MPPPRTRPRPRLAVAVVLAAGLVASARQPDPPKPTAVRLPDGTFQWVGPKGDGEVTLTPQELQKLTDQIEQLKKQLAAQKPAAPSGCAVRARVEKRGEQLVAAVRLTLTFRTTAPQAAVALGGKRGFLVSAALDGGKLPVLDTTDDGFAALVESAGDHTLVLDLEAPVTSRAARPDKPQLGFDLGLPKAAITTLLFDPPDATVKRVTVTTRTPDPAKPGPPDPRPTTLDVKQLAPRAGQDAGPPLGPVESVEVAWDPPAAAAQPADQVQSAEFEVSVRLTEGAAEATAKVRFRGPGREWKLVAPATAEVTADRVAAPDAPAPPATVTKPADPNKPVWKVEFPAGSPAADWVVTAVTRQLRPKGRGPVAVGPFAALDVFRQTGTVRVVAGPHTRLAFKHGPDLRRVDPGPPEDGVTAAAFRLTTGPTGTAVPTAALLSVEAEPLQGRVVVEPTYRLTLTDGGWRVRAEVRVTPLQTAVEAVEVEVPADWRGPEAGPANLVEGVQQGSPGGGFWAAAAARFAGGLRTPNTVRLAGPQKGPFDLVLTATVPVEPGAGAAVVPLPRFPGAAETRNATVTATVPDGLEVRGETRGWDEEYAAWGAALAPDGKPARATTAVAGRAEAGVSRAVLAWWPYRPELAADVRAEVTLGDRQMVVTETVDLRSPEGLPRPVRFRGPAGAVALKSTPPLEPVGPGEWNLVAPPDAKDLTLTATFAVNLPAGADGAGPGRVPVVLLRPAAATRSATAVQVWSNAAAPQAVAVASAGWLESPAERHPRRDALPALTLSAAGAEPLVLEVRPAADGGAVAVWAERGLIQAWATDGGATRYRARFLLRRWLAPAVEVRLPGPLAGPHPEFLRDGQKVDATPAADPDGGVAYRVPLPPARPGATTTVEVRYQLPADGGSEYRPPRLPGAAFADAVRWQVAVPDDALPVFAGGGRAEFRWKVRASGVVPVPAAGSDALDRWFRTGEPAGGDDGAAPREVVTVRQPGLAAVTVYRVPWAGAVVACSTAAFGLVLLLSRLPAAAVGPALAVVGGALGVAAVLAPQPAAQAAGACQPGVAAAVGVLVALAVGRWHARRGVARLPGFSRTPAEPSAPAALPSSARTRQAGAGTASGVPAVPAGG
ncbi:MAG: hypothetical protein C0501_29035 [Isosphaera sp.]|nr:hypothetical protein [Isosphaera sp.]